MFTMTFMFRDAGTPSLAQTFLSASGFGNPAEFDYSIDGRSLTIKASGLDDGICEITARALLDVLKEDHLGRDFESFGFTEPT